MSNEKEVYAPVPEDCLDLAAIRDVISPSMKNKNDQDFVLSSLWTHEQIPTVQDQPTYEEYARKAVEIKLKARSEGIDTRSVAWLHSQDGVLATCYGARMFEWEDQQGLR